MDNAWDCIIVGGGAAGLSAALVLGRARRRVLLVDAGNQSNLAAHGIGGLLGNDGRPPAELYARGRAELAAYPTVEVRSGEVVHGETGFTLKLADGAVERARAVLLATGMEYRPPKIKGLDELWGGSVFHCPFCHGWELRDAPLAVVARGDRAVHSALLLRSWTEDLVVLTDGSDGLDDAQLKQLDAAGIGVDDRSVAQFVSRDGELTAVEFTDGNRLPRRGALVATTLHQRSPLAAQLGAITAPGPLAVNSVAVDPLGRTSVPGLFAAGDLSSQMPQVAAAVASGSAAGAAVVQTLLADDVGLPVPPWPTEVLSAAEYWERHYGQRERIWSGRVNAQLENVVGDLPAGRVLDLGCGEGGDAVWFAEHGWQVTAVDISETALKRAAAEAQARGVGDRITFERHDLSETFPAGTFDLVSAQFLHSTVRLERPQILANAARAVAPGGRFVIVDHGAMPSCATNVPHDHPFPSAEEVLAGLDLPTADWDRERVETIDRQATWPDGQQVTLADNVMVLRRKA
ncbi:bifunctional NAD(P)/FAD-dependent oxidoreductase/class I SAM-dependent methyltransferase [[Mycobacterium] appelbergii]|uniref:bifunctional NAD(P)/FAD-dependent oxidoreductase/class I SAM-dependent methyltransferase n=1 Tax=[Mycobacterium] appelbergii TaxID=2939269 RepID=UPI002938F38B|nr:bifunctional NAD(P)/FAD-dependent oxidoreductase/class I SAM-dependent methyltransferase [Mycobacterium sp. 21AC1]